MKFVEAALKNITKNVQTLIELQEITSELMQKRRQYAEAELEKIWEDERAQPITYNHYYTDNVQKARHERIETAIGDSLKETVDRSARRTLNIYSSDSEFGGTDTAKLLAALKKSVNVDMDDQACREALIGLNAYYKVCILTISIGWETVRTAD